MALFSIDLHPARAIALIEDLKGNGVATLENVDSLTFWPQPQQIPMLEQICRKHSVELLEGLPTEQAKSLIERGKEAKVIEAQRRSSALRQEWQG